MTKRTNLYLDRFEGGLAILSGGDLRLELPREILPSECREGDFVTVDISIDEEARGRARAEIEETRKRLEEGGKRE